MLILVARQFGTVLTTAAYVAAGYALAFVTRSTPFGAATWQYLGAFALGALAADLSYGPTATAEVPAAARRFPWHAVAAVCLAIVAGATGVFGWKWVDRHVVTFDLPIAVATMAVLIGASRPGPNAVRRMLQWRPLAALGLFSYSLYIIHYPLADALSFGLLARITNEFAREAVLLGVVVPVVIAAAYGFYLLVERPSHHFARQIGRRPKPATSPRLGLAEPEPVGVSAE